MEVLDQEAKERLMQAIGDNVRRLRLQHGFTQTELAKKAGVTYVHVNRLENGHHEPSSGVLFAIADALNVKADDLRQISVGAS